MAVLMRQTMPEGVSVDMLDAVTEEMGVRENPPDGLVVHVHFEEDGRAQVVDVWDSPEAYQRFADERLMPAMQKVAEQHGGPAAPPPDGAAPDMVEVTGIVRGR
jgi:hypothetical protein